MRALAWIALGALSFVFGWQESIVLVWLASVYANVESAWSSAEAAAPDPTVIARLTRIETTQRAILRELLSSKSGGPS